MNGIEIIIQFFYAFFGEKRQADRAFSIHIYRYEIKTWAGVWINFSVFDLYFHEAFYSKNEANLPRLRFKFFKKTFTFRVRIFNELSAIQRKGTN